MGGQGGWDELERRLETADGVSLERGTITSKSVTPMRSHVHEPMRHGRLFLAGDTAGMVAADRRQGTQPRRRRRGDVRPRVGPPGGNRIGGTSRRVLRETCLRRVWQAERFSLSMTTLLHRAPDATPFEDHVPLARLRRIVTSRAAETDLAEGYTGFPLD